MTRPLTFLSFADVRGYLLDSLAAYGYGVDERLPLPLLTDVPPDSDGLKLSPQAIVFVDVGGGAGLTKEETFDRVFITVRVCGKQSDVNGARQLAMAVDRSLLTFDSSGMLGDTYTLGVSRTGGAPRLFTKDNAGRYHFTAGYIAEAETGL